MTMSVGGMADHGGAEGVISGVDGLNCSEVGQLVQKTQPQSDSHEACCGFGQPSATDGWAGLKTLVIQGKSNSNVFF